MNTESTLGYGMAHRARAQTVLAQHWSATGVVGAVGKASVGFSLAVGRSRAIRPTVCVDDLNSAALRPALDAWKMRTHGADDPSVDGTDIDLGEPVTDRVGGRDGGRVGGRVGSTGARPATPTVRRHVARKRPTWTDQVIERSTVGYTAPPAGSVEERAAVPTDFVASGDAQLDRLRLLVRQQQDGPRRRPSTSAPPAARADDVVRRVREPRPTQPVERGDTAAGRSTGPGHLARALRPEPVDDAQRGTPTARPGASVPASPASSGSVATSATDAGRRSAPTGTRGRTSRRDSSATDKMDALRAALIERGLLDDASTGDDAASSAVDAGGIVSEGRAPDDSGRPTHTSEVLRRSVAERPARPNEAARPARPTSQPPTQQSYTAGEHGPRDPGPSERVPSDRVRRDPGSSDRVPRGSAHGAALADGAGERTSPERNRTGEVARAAHAMVSTPRPVSSNQQLRAQRLLASGLAPVARALTEMQTSSDGTTLVRDPDEALDDLDDRPVRPPANVASTAAPAAPDALRRTPDSEVARSPRTAGHDTPMPRPTSWPTLASRTERLPRLAPVMSRGTVADSVEHARPAVLRRRVTLPRALSSAHRPTTRLSSIPDVRPPDQGSPAPPVPAARSMPLSLATPGDRPSAVPMADRTAALEPTSSRVDHAQGPTNTTPTTAAGAGQRSADVGQRSRALLDVIRRQPRQPRRPLGSTAAPLPRVAAAGSTPARAIPAGAAPSTPRTGSAQGDIDAHATTIADRVVAPTIAAAMVPNASSSPASGDRGPDGDEHVADPRRPAERVAAQFMSELARTVRTRPTPLPVSYQPLAESIAGPRPVMLSTDAASRRALRSVGKVAATTGDTIHLDRASISGARLNEVMAHELTHIAAPSPAPRFFDDIDDSPEERRAEQVGRLMARSPLAPSSSVVTPPGAPTIRRSAADPSARSGSAPSIDASDLAARIRGGRNTSAGRESGVIRRWNSAQPSGRAPTMGNRPGPSRPSRPAPPPPSVEPAPPAPAPVAQEQAVSGYSLQADPSAAKWFEKQLAAQLQPLIRMIEDRMIVELERRGGRSWRSN